MAKGTKIEGKKGDGEAAVKAKIAAMEEPFRSLGERLHALIVGTEPKLEPRVWYGMPGYARSKSGRVLCFFRADKYMTFGLTEHASFSEGTDRPSKLIASGWFFTDLDDATEAEIVAILAAAVG